MGEDRGVEGYKLNSSLSGYLRLNNWYTANSELIINMHCKRAVRFSVTYPYYACIKINVFSVHHIININQCSSSWHHFRVIRFSICKIRLLDNILEAILPYR